MKNKKIKKNKCPAITKTDNDLWQDLTSRTKEKYNTVKNGKGSNRRQENIKSINQNWDLINWSTSSLAE